VAWLEALWKEATHGPVRSPSEILGKDRAGRLTRLRGKIDRVFQASSALCRKFESVALQSEFEERQRNNPRNWSPLRQRFEAFKSIRELQTGPHERIPEAFVRDAIADQLGIKPEEVTWKQIQFEIAGLLRDYPAITLVPTEPPPSTKPDESTPQSVTADQERTETIADQLERLRDECRWTIPKLAEAAGIDSRTVDRHLTGKVTPYARTISAYERAFSKLLKRHIVIKKMP
jgi:hypothetical protein